MVYVSTCPQRGWGYHFGDVANAWFFLFSGPGCVNNPYDNQKDAKLSDGSGDHNDSIGSFRCWYKGRAPRD